MNNNFYKNDMELWDRSKLTFLGYPCNQKNDFSEVFPTLNYNLNNIGEPSIYSNYKINSKKYELKVIDFFSKIWKINSCNLWSYITNGSTESNIQGLYLAREAYPLGILYCSKESHYSVFKASKILKLPIKMIDTLENGEIDYDKLSNSIDTNYPVIINVNFGTTMKGAFDDINKIMDIIKVKNIKNYYVHVDAALAGGYFTFIDDVDLLFTKHINSMSISLHKFYGIPIPSGIFLCEKYLVESINTEVEYIFSKDRTLSGSRNGHTALFMNYLIETKGIKGFKEDINYCLELTEYFIEEYEKILNKKAWKNENSITVVFERPSSDIIAKWQLACENKICHIVILSHITKEIIDEFIEDLYYYYKYYK
jgi:histidine decarboxylase